MIRPGSLSFPFLPPLTKPTSRPTLPTMKFLPVSILLLACGLPAGMVHAQAAASPSAEPAAAPALTEAQASSVLNQLKELEAQIQQMRGSNLSTILTRLREGLASDQAAMALYLECDTLVNSKRKEADKGEARQRKEMMERNLDRRPKGGGNSPASDDGDAGFAIRLGLQYLILTLEAHETKDEELGKLVPKLQEYLQTLTAAAPKLKGNAYNRLSNALSPNNPVIEAFSLAPYIQRKNWTNRPLDIGGIYLQTLLPLAKKEDMPALWDARINTEGIFRKEQMFAPEFELWTKNELPTLRWQRATYLYEKGPSPVNGMADMLKVIRENPGHASAPEWVKSLRQLINQAAPSQASPGAAEATSGT